MSRAANCLVDRQPVELEVQLDMEHLPGGGVLGDKHVTQVVGSRTDSMPRPTSPGRGGTLGPQQP